MTEATPERVSKEENKPRDSTCTQYTWIFTRLTCTILQLWLDGVCVSVCVPRASTQFSARAFLASSSSSSFSSFFFFSYSRPHRRSHFSHGMFDAVHVECGGGVYTCMFMYDIQFSSWNYTHGFSFLFWAGCVLCFAAMPLKVVCCGYFFFSVCVRLCVRSRRCCVSLFLSLSSLFVGNTFVYVDGVMMITMLLLMLLPMMMVMCVDRSCICMLHIHIFKGVKYYIRFFFFFRLYRHRVVCKASVRGILKYS